MNRPRATAGLAMLFAAGTATAGLAPSGTIRTFDSPVVGTAGRGVAVTSTGKVILVGRDASGCGAVAGFRLSWVSPSYGEESTMTFAESCVAEEPRGVLAVGEDALVFGEGSGHGVISLVHRGASSPAFTFDEPGISEGFKDGAVDPVDGTLWMVGTAVAPAPGVAKLFHYKVESSGLTTLSVDAYTAAPASDTHGFAVAAAEDAVFVGGFVNTAGINVGWLALRPKAGSTAQAWLNGNVLGTGNTMVWSIAARGGRLYTLTIAATGAPYSADVQQRSPADGSRKGSSLAAYTGNSPTWADFRGQVVLHPTLPLLGIAGGAKMQVKDLDLNSFAGYGGQLSTNNIIEVDGAAFSNALQFTAYAAATYDQAAMLHMELDGQAFADSSRTKTDRQLVVAPNVLVLADPLGFLRFSVVHTVAGADVRFSVYDAAGRFLADKTVAADAGASAEWLWDGTLPDGKQRIGPGGYLVRVDGPSADAFTDRANFIVVKKRTGK